MRAVLKIIKKKRKEQVAAYPESRAIVLRDQSSSMSWVPAFPKHWNKQIEELGQLAPTLHVSLYSVTSEIDKLCDRVPIGRMARIDPARWYYGERGMLRGGTALGDAVVRGCQKAKQYRRLGFDGPISIFLLTDGWSKDDVNPLFVANNWLNHARENLNVTFRMFGFVHQHNHEKLKQFSKEIGVRSGEDCVIPYSEDDERDTTLRISLESLKEALYNTTQETTGYEAAPSSASWMISQ